MATRNIPCESTPKIFIEMNDHLSLTGWDKPEIEIDIANERDLIVSEKPDGFNIEGEDDCLINVPVDALVTIGNVNGSASITNLNNDLAIENVGGHLTVRQIKNLVTENVGGHLRFSEVRGDLSSGNVGGNMKGESLLGSLTAGNVGGSIKIADLHALVKAHAGGNIKARLSSLPGDIKAYAGGSIKLMVPEGSGYELEASSGGTRIVLVTNHERSRYSTGHQRMTVAGGGPLVQLTAGGSITVMDSDSEEEHAFEDFDFLGSEALSSNVDDLSERINQRIRSKVENVEERMRVTQERAERHARLASERAEHQVQRALERMSIKGDIPPVEPYHPGSVHVPPVAPPPSRSKASDEERLMILNMLKEGRITADEAARLLDVLDGKSNAGNK